MPPMFSGSQSLIKQYVGSTEVSKIYLGVQSVFSGYEVEATTLFMAMSPEPSSSRKQVINTLIKELKAAGVWSKFDRLYMMAAHSEQAAKLDWLHPGTDNLTPSGSITFHADRGWFGTGTTGTVTNTVAFNALGSKYTLNDAHFSAWLNEYQDTDTGKTTAGTSSANYVQIAPYTGGSANVTFAINCANGSGSSISTGINSVFKHPGWLMAQRFDSTKQYGYRNGVSLGFGTVASTSLPTSQMSVVRNSLSLYSMMSAGASLSDPEAAAAYAALNKYMASVGAIDSFSGTSWTFDWLATPSIKSSEGWLPESYYLDPCTGYDFEGVPFYTSPKEAVFCGYRRVKNMLTNTEAMSTQSVSVVNGNQYRLSFSGSGSVTMSGAATGSVAGQGLTTRVASNVLTATTASLTLTVSGAVTQAQLEDVTYQSNKNPAEYVSVGALGYPFHGAGVDGVKHFTVQNGNTVSGGVVTLATGSAIPSSTILGLYFGEKSANRCLQSESMGTSPWSAVGTPTRTAAAKQCGFVKMDLIGDDASGALEGYQQTVTFVTSSVGAYNQIHGISAFVAQGTSTSSVIQLRDTTGSADRLLAVLTWSGGLPVVTASVGTYHGYEALANGVFRLMLESTSITFANTNVLSIYPASDAALSTTMTGDLYVGGIQAEDFILPTMYIPTTTAVASRQDQTLMQQSPSGLPWFNSTDGMFVQESRINFNNYNTTLGQQYFYQASDALTGSNNRMMHIRFPSASAPKTVFLDYIGGTSVADDNHFGGVSGYGLTWQNGETHRTAYAYKDNGFKVCWDGGTVYSHPTADVPANINSFSIGSGIRYSPPCGYMRYMAYRPYPTSDSAMSAAAAI